MAIETQDVSAWAEINDGEAGFQVKSLEVKRDLTNTIGQATIKGFPQNIDAISLGTDVDVFIATESVSEPWNKSLNSSRQVFGGYANSAKQNEEGVVIVEAFEPSQAIFDKTVKLNVDGTQYTDAVLIDIMREAYGTVTQNLDEATKRIPYIAGPDNITPGSFPVQQRPWQFGSAERGEPLINVLNSLTKSLGAEWWVDRTGTVRVEAYPEYTPWNIPFVTEVESGEETRNAERVIFQANPSSSDLGQAGSYTNQQTSPESQTDVEGQEDEPEAPEKTITDRNVTTQEGADNQSFRTAVEEDQRRDFGKVTIIGNANIELYDHVILPEVEFNVINTSGITRELENKIQQGEYKVDGVQHKVNPQDGFLTTLQLSPPIEQTYNACSVNGGTPVSQEYLARDSNQRQEGQVSGVSNNTAGLDDDADVTISAP